MTREEARIALGAYVVGALEPDERAEVERWLATDASLREEVARLAALPGLLARLHEPGLAGDVSDAGSAEADRLVAAAADERVAARRRLRLWQAAAALAAVVALALGVVGAVAVLDDSPAAQTARAEGPRVDVAVADPVAVAAGMTGVVQANPRGWGAEVVLELWDVPYASPEAQYTMVIVASDGRSEQAAAWGSTPSGQCRVTGATSIQAADIAHIEIRSGGGPVLASADLV